jgi:Tfp pilus assembly protein PilX
MGVFKEGKFMKINRKVRIQDRGQAGGALVMVIMISFLLVTASVAMLTAVGANSKNTTDVLAETKAYYAAESGLQATINVLRNDSSVDYEYAASNPTLNAKLNYQTINGISQVRVGTEAGYSINVVDPDNSANSITFFTQGTFSSTTGVVLEDSGRTMCLPNCLPTTTNRIIVRWTNVGSSTYSFSPEQNQYLGGFTVEKYGALTTAKTVDFVINLKVSPRDITRSIRGAVSIPAVSTNPVSITFQTQEYQLAGSEIELCPSTTPGAGGDKCATVSFNLQNNGVGPLYANITPLEPYRLKITATGYGPHSSRKQLEGIVRKSFLDGLSATSGLSMVGPGAQLIFSPGAGNPTYCGVDPGVEPGQPIPNNPACVVDPNQPTGPAIGVSDQDGLNTVLAATSGTSIVPAPAIVIDNPTWQKTPSDLNEFISLLRTSAQHSERYLSGSANFQNASGAAPYINAAENLSGEGLTFVDGDLNVGPISGGGILVVMGNFNYNGGFNWRGLIVVAGLPGTGVTRTGAGSGVILGNLVIAPYDPTNLSAFGSPSFSTTGGGSSDLMFSGYSLNFDGTNAVNNFMAGVAEK